MYHIKDDQRSIRSSEMIYSGLAQLMREKAYHDITVTDLVHAAKVGRTTFYRNFDEIEDVLRWRCDQVLEGVMRYLQEYRRSTHQQEIGGTMLKPMLRYFYLHSELIELLLQAERISLFEEAMFRQFAPLKPLLGAFYQIDAEYVEYLMAIRIGGVTNILTHWVETGKRQAPDDLADRLNAIVGSGTALEHLL